MSSDRSFDGLAESYDRREQLSGDPLEPWLRAAPDSYLARAEFERRYARHFPGADFTRAMYLHICSLQDG